MLARTLLAVLLVAASAAIAQTFNIPARINFQGYLTNGTGVPITGTVPMRFRLMTAATGGSVAWYEPPIPTGAVNVQVTNGLYNVALGTTSPLTTIALSGGPRFLEVIINPDTTPETLSPRTMLLSVPYAYLCDDLGGVTAVSGHLRIPLDGSIRVNDVTVLRARQAAVAPAVDATGVDLGNGPGTMVVTVAEYNALVATVNDLLNKLRTHGLIEP